MPRLRATPALLALGAAAAACAQPPPDPPMTRSEFRARVGVACITPGLLPRAFEQLPIGFYKDFHPLGDAHRGAPWAARLDAQPYLPVIQYLSLHDTPEIRALLRTAAESGQFPAPAGVSVDDLLALLERSTLEDWLVARTADGSFPRGTLFLLGNEPGYAPNHDPRNPQQLVEDARLIRDIFERRALAHRLALGGISTPDNAYNRRAYGMRPLDYFDAVLAEAARRDVAFDAFVIHPYPFDGMDLPGGLPQDPDPEAFARNSIAQIRAFRDVMLRRGQRDRDLIVGETGLPFALGDDPGALVAGYADRILTWCLTATDERLGHAGDDHRLVQRFTWFLLAVPDGPAPGITDHPIFVAGHTVLLTPDGALTPLARAFIAAADRLAPAP